MMSKKDVKKYLPKTGEYTRRYTPMVSQKHMYLFDRHTGLSTPIIGETPRDVIEATASGKWKPLHEWNFAWKMQNSLVKLALAKAKAKKVI